MIFKETIKKTMKSVEVSAKTIKSLIFGRPVGPKINDFAEAWFWAPTGLRKLIDFIVFANTSALFMVLTLFFYCFLWFLWFS